MTFSDRVKTVEKYYDWLHEHCEDREDFLEVMDCHLTFLSFLQIEGLLKEKEVK